MGQVGVVERGELGAYAAAWDALVDSSPLPSPFLRSWWLEQVGGTSPLYLLVLDGDELVGGLALDADRVRGVRRLRYLGAGPLAPDHLDLVARPDRQGEVVALLRRWLGRPGSRLLDLEGTVTASRLRAALPGPVHEERAEVAPYVTLPGDAAALMARLSSRVRNTVRRTTRRLEAAGARHRVAEPADVERALEDLRRLHTERWEAGSGFLPSYEGFAAAVRHGVGRGEVVLHELVVGDEVIACEVDFEVAGRASFYQGGRSGAPEWRGAGTMLRAAVVARACDGGLTEYDLLRGDEAYKRDWADGRRPLVRLRAASGAAARAVLLAMLAEERARAGAAHARHELRRVRAARGGGAA